MMSEQASEKPDGPQARLLWQTAQGEEQERLLGEGVITVGRGGDCDIVVMDTRVSRCHAEVRCDGSAFSVADLDSVNGTFVNEDRIEEPRGLQDGDRLRVGPVLFHFELFPAEAPSEEELPQRPTLVMPEPSAMPALEVVSGPQSGVCFDLVKDKIVVGRAGRGRQWDIVLQDRAVSRPHAQIVHEEERFVLADLDSANGTLVNGEEISEPCALADGDAITFGEVVVIFHAGAE